MTARDESGRGAVNPVGEGGCTQLHASPQVPGAAVLSKQGPVGKAAVVSVELVLGPASWPTQLAHAPLLSLNPPVPGPLWSCPYCPVAHACMATAALTIGGGGWSGGAGSGAPSGTGPLDLDAGAVVPDGDLEPEGDWEVGIDLDMEDLMHTIDAIVTTGKQQLLLPMPPDAAALAAAAAAAPATAVESDGGSDGGAATGGSAAAQPSPDAQAGANPRPSTNADAGGGREAGADSSAAPGPPRVLPSQQPGQLRPLLRPNEALSLGWWPHRPTRRQWWRHAWQHKLQRWFGVDAFLLLQPQSFTKRLLVGGGRDGGGCAAGVAFQGHVQPLGNSTRRTRRVMYLARVTQTG